MGPYCRFCNQRCFVHMPMNTPKHIVEAYGTSTIIATCPEGQKFEKDKVGYCYQDIKDKIEEFEQMATIGLQPDEHEEYERRMKELTGWSN